MILAKTTTDGVSACVGLKLGGGVAEIYERTAGTDRSFVASGRTVEVINSFSGPIGPDSWVMIEPFQDAFLVVMASVD